MIQIEGHKEQGHKEEEEEDFNRLSMSQSLEKRTTRHRAAPAARRRSMGWRRRRPDLRQLPRQVSAHVDKDFTSLLSPEGAVDM